MSYGPLKLLGNNLLTIDNTSAINPIEGDVSGAVKVGTGSATVNTVSSSFFKGPERRILYTMEIDSVASGNEVGQATFRWKTSLTISGWEASGVLTSAVLNTLNFGVAVTWTGGSGNDFELGDIFTFWAIPTYGANKALNLLDPSEHYEGSSYISVDFGTDTNVKAIGVGFHNISQLTVEANSVDIWTSPPYSNVVSITELTQIIYLDETYRYWRLTPVDTSFEKIGALGMYGEILEISTINAEWGSRQNLQGNVNMQESPNGITYNEALSWQDGYALDFRLTDNDDIDNVRALLKVLYYEPTGVVSGAFLHLFSDEADKAIVVRLEPRLDREYQTVDINNFRMIAKEVPNVSI